MASQCGAVSNKFLHWHSSVGLFQLSFYCGVPVYPASIRWVAQWYPSVHWVSQWHSSGTPVYWLRVRVEIVQSFIKPSTFSSRSKLLHPTPEACFCVVYLGNIFGALPIYAFLVVSITVNMICHITVTLCAHHRFSNQQLHILINSLFRWITWESSKPCLTGPLRGQGVSTGGWWFR